MRNATRTMGSGGEKRSEEPLFRHLLLSMLLLVVVLMGVISVVVYYRQKELLETQLLRNGRSITLSLAGSFRDHALQFEYTTIQESLQRLEREGVIDYAYLVNGEKVLAAGSPDAWLARADDIYSRRALKVAADKEVAGPFDVVEGGRRYMEFVASVVPEGPARAVLRIGYDVERRIESELGKTQSSMAMIFCGALMLGALLAYWIAGKLVAPISRLAVKAKTMAFGGYYEPIEPESSILEIRELAEALNYMRQKIEAHIDELDEAYQELDRKLYELKILYDVAKTLNFKSYSPEVLAYILDTCLQAVDAEWGSIMLYDENREALEVRLVRGKGFRKHSRPLFKPGQGISGKAFERGEAVIANEGYRDPDFWHFEGQEQYERRIRNLVCVPLLADNKAIGVINVINKRGGRPFTESDANLLTALGSQIARSLENARLYDLAIRESKTGLYIPRYFEARLKERLHLARRYGHCFSILIIDIDHFKRVNDEYGHLVGDEVLVTLSRFIKESIRENIDIASRFGGEEFAVLLPETDKEGARAFAERLRRLVEEKSGDPDRGVPAVTVSIGVATFPYDGADEMTLMHKADTALYRAKNGGRNRVCVAGEE